MRSAPEGQVPAEGETLARRITSRSGPDYKVNYTTGCWEWQKSLNKAGYPCGYPKPHREYFRLANPGVNIAGLDVHHKCGNTACVNPDHLEPVHRRKHLADHKRAVSKLTAADVLAIRLSHKTSVELAEIYGIPAGTVENLWTRNWAGVPMVKPTRYCKLCGERVPDSRTRKAIFCSVEHRTEYQRQNKAAA